MTQVQQSNTAVKKFILRAMVLYGVWYVFRAFVLSPYTHFDELFIERLVFSNAWILSNINHYTVYLVDSQNSGFLDSIFAQNAGGVQVGEECDGIGVISTFIIFILAFPGKHKILYALSGALCVHLLNLLRVWILILIQIHRPETLEFNHKYTFNIIIYSFIFALWFLYTKYFKKDAAL